MCNNSILYLGRRFNSRSREGATIKHHFDQLKTGFNSRSREGATDAVRGHIEQLGVSIHAPVRERQGARRKGMEKLTVSIHAPVRERPDEAELLGVDKRFQFTLP